MDTGDALVTIAEEDIDALRLVGDIMEANAASLQNLQQNLYEWEKEAHERTKEKLACANERLARIESRLLWILGEDLDEYS